MKTTEKPSNASPQNIMNAFKQANNDIAASSSIDEMIAAYDKVISFCSNSAQCRNERSTKRDVLLYWAYSNIANSYRKKNMPMIANKYYQKALSIAVSRQQKIMALEAMLTETGKEELLIADKCKKIIGISNQLIDIYRQEDDKINLQRIIALSEKTLELLKKADA
ncbi:MAG: hypothetical protein E7012_04260 [Alphaproteobacteria bacterium]|nr:hypothetical protein [Alphaproteobacteria bacterium]